MIKSPIKTKNDNSNIITDWIIKNFPEDYEKMRYIEPFVGNGSVLLNKLNSIEEVVSNYDIKIIELWKAIRDENENFTNELSKLKYNQKTYNLIKNKLEEKEMDYFENALNNFIISKMGQNKLKKIDKKKSYSFWKDQIKIISEIQERIKNVYFLVESPFEVIKKFDNDKTFCFCAAPFYDEKKSEMTTDEYIVLSDLLLDFRGKLMMYSNNCVFYRRLFKNWKTIKQKGKNSHCLWINF